MMQFLSQNGYDLAIAAAVFGLVISLIGYASRTLEKRKRAARQERQDRLRRM